MHDRTGYPAVQPVKSMQEPALLVGTGNVAAKALALKLGSGVLHPLTFAKSWSCGTP